MANYLHLRRERVNRRDFDAAAMEFLQRKALLSQQRLLDPDLAVKAMIPDAQPSKKRSAGGVQENEPRLVYDQSAKRRPGQWFKHWATPEELTRSGDNPNFGWMDRVGPPTPGKREEAKRAFIQKARDSQVKIQRFPIDPRTGLAKIDEDVEVLGVKALGPSLRNLMPGARAGARTAARAGLIVDDLGKFRCPPGTPAANQFTDAFGSNCFKPVSTIRSMLNDLGSVLRGNFRYVDPNMLGLDPDKAPAIRKAIENIAGTPDDLREAMGKVEAALDALRQRFNTGSDATNNKDLFEIFEALEAAGELSFDWKDILTDIWGEKFQWDNSVGIEENLRNHKIDLVNTIVDFFTIDDQVKAQLLSDYYRGDSFIVQMFEEKIATYQRSVRGAMTALLHMKEEQPDVFKRLESVTSVLPNDPEKFKQLGFAQVDDQGRLSIDFNFTYSTLMPQTALDKNGLPTTLQKDGKWTMVYAEGDATEAAKLEAIREFMTNAARNEAFAVQYKDAYGSDMAEALYMSEQARYMQVAYHEFAHVAQYSMVQDVIDDRLATVGYVDLLDGTRLSGPVSGWTAEEYSQALFDTLLYPTINENNGRVPPFGVDGLEGDMLHLLAGGYYQQFVQDWLAARRRGDNPAAYKLQGLIVMEAMAEMFALRQMGILKGEDVDNSVDWMFEASPNTPPKPMAPSVPTPPPAGPNPPSPPAGPNPPRTPGGGRPGIPTIDPPDTDADDAASTFVPLEVETLVDTETGEIVPARSTWERFSELWNKKKGFSTPGERRTGEAQKERSHINVEFGFDDISYDYVDGAELDVRFELMRDEADRLRDIARTRTLTDDEAARMWLAMRGMEQILNQNDRRRRMGPDAALQARREGKKTTRGSYVKPNLTETGFDFEPYESMLHSLAKHLGDTNNPFDRVKKNDDLGVTYLIDTTRIFEPPRPFRRVRTPLNSAAFLDDAIKSAVARKRSGAAGADSVQMPSQEMKTVILPMMKDMDENPLDRDVEMRISLPNIEDIGVGDSLDHGTFLHGRITTGDTEGVAQAVPNSGGSPVRVVMPKGSKGLRSDDDMNGSGQGLTIPPGTLRVIAIDDDGTVVVTPVRQKSMDDFTRDVAKKVNGMSSTVDPGEMRERRRLKRAALDARGTSNGPRKGFASSTSSRSEDVTSAAHAEHRRRVSFDRAKEEHDFEPFVLRQDQIDALRAIVEEERSRGVNYSQAIRYLGGNSLLDIFPITREERAARKRQVRSTSVENLRAKALAGGGNINSNDVVLIDMDPVVRDFLATASVEEIEATIDAAFAAHANGFERQIRVAIGKERLDSVAQTGRYLTTHETKSDHSEPGIRAQVEFSSMGYPVDAPADMRPASGFVRHAHHVEVRQEALKGFQFTGLQFPERDHEYMSPQILSPEGSASSIYGNSQIVLKQDVSRRSAMLNGDSARDGANMPARFTSNDPDEWMVATAPHRNGGESDFFYHNLLQAHLTGDREMLMSPQSRVTYAEGGKAAVRASREGRYGNSYHEALVHGGFELDDIDHVKIDIRDMAPASISPDELGSNDESVTAALRDAGLSPDEIARVFSILANEERTGLTNVVNVMDYLRAAKQATVERDKWAKHGIDIVPTNPWAIDILDPDTFTSLPHPYKITPGDSVSVLQQFVKNQLIRKADRVASWLRDNDAREARLASMKVPAGSVV